MHGDAQSAPDEPHPYSMQASRWLPWRPSEWNYRSLDMGQRLWFRWRSTFFLTVKYASSLPRLSTGDLRSPSHKRTSGTMPPLLSPRAPILTLPSVPQNLDTKPGFFLLPLLPSLSPCLSSLPLLVGRAPSLSLTLSHPPPRRTLTGPNAEAPRAAEANLVFP